MKQSDFFFDAAWRAEMDGIDLARRAVEALLRNDLVVAITLAREAEACFESMRRLESEAKAS